MVKKTLKKNNKNLSNFSGGSNVWSDLLKMSITGIIGIVAGYMSRSRCDCSPESEEK